MASVPDQRRGQIGEPDQAGPALDAVGCRPARLRARSGEVRILQSVQAADAGVVMNPQQCRGQVEGGVAQAIGSALYEQMLIGPDGTVLTQALRNYHIPQLADVPVTEVLFADTYDQIGPLGAKSMSESPYNPVAPAIGNAISRALGTRVYEQPFSRDRVWRALQEGFGMPRH